MIHMYVEWLAEQRDYGRFVELLGVIRHPEGGRSVLKPMQPVIERQEEWQPIEEGSLRLDQKSAVSLMTALWQAGLRPHGLKATDGEIKRLEDHLADMRKLVFEK